MGNLKGFEKGFTHSKVAVHKIISDSGNPGIWPNKFGLNVSKQNVGLSSNTKAAINPTSDLDENPRAGGAPQKNGNEAMVPSSVGGASGDGSTPGYTGGGSGISQLNGAQGN